MAAQKTAQRHPGSWSGAMQSNRFSGIFRACGPVFAAGWEQRMDGWREPVAIEGEDGEQESFHDAMVGALVERAEACTPLLGFS